METNPEVPASTRDEALFYCTKPSGVPRGPSQLQAMQELQETQVQSLGQEDPLEKGMATHSSILAWRIPLQRSLAGYSP